MKSAAIVTVSDLDLLEAFYPNLKHFDPCKLHIVCYDKSDSVLDFSSHDIIARCKSFGYSPCVDIVSSSNRSEAVNAVISSLDLSEIEHVFILDESLTIGSDFMDEMKSCFSPAKVSTPGGAQVIGCQDVAIVGACLSGDTQSQGQRVLLTQQDIALGLEGYCNKRVEHFSGQASMSAWIDGRFLCIKSKYIKRITSDKLLLDLGLVQYAWHDLCLRLAKEGLSCLVSEAAFALIDSSANDVLEDAVDRLRFYSKHPVDTNPSISVLYRACIRSWQDLQVFRASIMKSARCFDSMAVVLLNSPSDIQYDFEFNQVKGNLSRQDKDLLEKCQDSDRGAVEKAFKSWINYHVSMCRKDMLVSDFKIKVQIPQDSRHQSSQINSGLGLVESLGSSGVLILDHDELVDDQLNRHEIKRLLGHPDPLIQAFDFQLVYHWDSPTLVRTEPPFGPTREYTGAPSAVRLYRKCGNKFARCHRTFGEVTTVPTPEVAEQSTSVSSMRIRLMSLTRAVDRLKTGMTGSEEHVSVSTYQPKTSLGFHMLAYENEDPEDIARWMNTIYSMCRSIVIVWTGEWLDSDKEWTTNKSLISDGSFKTGPSRSLAAICTIYGANIVHCPLNDDISAARNAGINHLSKNQSLKWAMFVDPDEWFKNEASDCRSIRAMLSSDRCGFLFKVANYRSEQEVPTISDSVRISRLDGALSMRMSGRVHESFDKSIQVVQSKGLHPRLTYAPFVLQHRGMSFDTATMDVKLTKYERLLRLDLEDDQDNPGAWVSLGWHYLNDGHSDMGFECYANALRCAGTSYLPYKEMAFLKLREARELLSQCEERLTPAHQFHKLCHSMNEWLVQYAPPHPVIDRGRDIELTDMPTFKVQ